MNTDIHRIKAPFDAIKLCVFDMAGTTVNENNLVYKTVCDAINHTLQQVGQTDIQVNLEVCLEFGAGKEKRQAISDILNEVCKNDNTATADSEKWKDAAFNTFKSALASAYTKDTVATFDGMLDFFNQLKQSGRKVVLNTGYDIQTANKILAILGKNPTSKNLDRSFRQNNYEFVCSLLNKHINQHVERKSDERHEFTAHELNTIESVFDHIVSKVEQELSSNEH